MKRFAVLAFVVCALAGRVAFAQAAPPLPAAVRISTGGYNDVGKISVRGAGLVARVIDEGWLEHELAQRGVKLEWFPVIGDVGAITNEAFASGRIDFANYGDFPSVTLNAAGFRTQVIVPSGRGSDMFLVVPTSSTARSIQDLKGKRISVNRGRPWDLGLQKLLEANGLEEKDFKIINLSPEAGAAALAAGKVDAHFTISAYALEEKGVGKIIWSTAGKPLHFKMRAELWGSSEFVRKYPELTQLVATAYVKAAYWASQDANRETVIKIGTRNGTPESVVRRQYADPSLSWRERWNPLPDEVVLAHYRDVVKFATERKLIRARLRPEDLIQTKFVETALKNLGLQEYWKPRQLDHEALR
jgi:sulfonate transport system substrate-binding protein